MTQQHVIRVNGKSFSVLLLDRQRNSVKFSTGGRTYLVEFEESAAASSGQPTQAKPVRVTATGIRPHAAKHAKKRGLVPVLAPMPGVVTAVLVSAGSKVEAGAALLRVEAMKMDNSIVSPAAGTVVEILVKPGDEITDAEELAQLKID